MIDDRTGWDITIVDGFAEQHDTLFDAVEALLDALKAGKACEVRWMFRDGSTVPADRTVFRDAVLMVEEDTDEDPAVIAAALALFPVA